MNSLQEENRERINSEIKKNNPDCRFKHLKLHTPVPDKKFCDYCESWVEVEGRHTCSCCMHMLAPTKNNEHLNDVLQEGMRIYGKHIEMWATWPTKNHPHLIICFKNIFYEIPIKFMVLSQEPIKKSEMLQIIREKTVVKGIGFSSDKEKEYKKIKEKILKHYDKFLV